MKKKLLVANWKMNNNHKSGIILLNKIKKRIKNNKNKKFVILPPVNSILYFKNILKNKIIFGSQDCSQFDKGAYTGDISANMIRIMGCKYVLLGHSERRIYYKENNAMLVKKVELAVKNKLKIIFCVGESFDDYKNNKSTRKLKEQLNNIFNKDMDFKNLVIAYEPVWAIGTNKTPQLSEIEIMHQFIKKFISKKYSFANIPVLYGGSVNSSNSKNIFSLKSVNGGLIGGASLIASEFCKIYDSL